MPRLWMISSASGVVGPLAPSAMILTRLWILFDVGRRDLVLEGGGDEEVGFLLDPSLAGKNLVAGLAGLGFVDRPELVGDGHQLVRVDAAFPAEGIGGLIGLIPARNADAVCRRIPRKA